MTTTEKQARSLQIVLATYNGASYLRQQLESLATQTWKDFEVLVSDDLSTDGTIAILEEFEVSGRLNMRHTSNESRKGSKANFAHMLARTTADYVMCCDQDDIWFPDKVERSLGTIRNLEAQHGSGIPIMVYTDVEIIDADSRQTHRSFWNMAGVRPEKAKFRNLLVQNLATGCTTIANRALLNRILPLPVSKIIMHDYWMALAACGLGILHPLYMQTMGYRQHASNVIGTGRPATIGARLKRFIADPVLEDFLQSAKTQAAAFTELFGPALSSDDREALDAFQKMAASHGMRRRCLLLQHRLFRTGFLNHWQFFLRV